ncbi:retron-type reverse transcriptase [Rhizobium paranaense]|uniref:Retron-type reverse transcriptase n=1 Tax=Rhizobium paranaense TaxID=1650438 RepID=A0A7W8XYT0_9HYPH|nr:retron-type reverse transcriptase [Rhizobium paranaense]
MTSTDATDKPFMIDKRLVYEAYKAVKSNGGAAGVDGQTIEAFEADLRRNLYRIWNRMSSGSYFPPPVRAVPIPKKTGGQRILGVPTVSDRIAQMVVKRLIEPELDQIFKPDTRPKNCSVRMGTMICCSGNFWRQALRISDLRRGRRFLPR